MTDEEQKQIITDNLLRLIKREGIDQRRVCTDLNIKPATFNQWVRAKAIPSLVTLRELAAYFGVSLYDIIEPEPPSNALMSAVQPFLSEEAINILSRYKRAPEYRQRAIQDLLGGDYGKDN